MKKVNEKLFTKDEWNNIMATDYNPLNKDEGFYKREGLFMEETKDIVLDEVMKELKKGTKWYNRFIICIFKDLFYYTYRKGMNDCFKYYNK